MFDLLIDHTLSVVDVGYIQVLKREHSAAVEFLMRKVFCIEPNGIKPHRIFNRTHPFFFVYIIIHIGCVRMGKSCK